MASLKRGRFSPGDGHHCALLEPLLPLLQRSMRNDSDAVVSLSLRTVGSLMGYPMQSLPRHAMALLERTLAILKRAANSRGTELVAIGLKVVTTLIRRPPVSTQAPAGGRANDQGAKGPKRARDAEGGEDGADDDDDDDDDDDETIGGGVLRAEVTTVVEAVAAAGPRVGGGASLSESQLRWLISFVTVHLEDVTLQPALFGLLRAWPRLDPSPLAPLPPSPNLPPSRVCLNLMVSCL